MAGLPERISVVEAKIVRLEAKRDEYIRSGDRESVIAIRSKIAALYNHLTGLTAQPGMFPPPVSVLSFPIPHDSFI